MWTTTKGQEFRSRARKRDAAPVVSNCGASYLRSPIEQAMINPIPKPTKRDRPKRPMDTRALAHPKVHALRDGDYREWIRTRPCLLASLPPCDTKPDRAPIEAAHLDRGGRGIKGSDASCIPLCPVHHDLLDGQTLDWQIIAFLWKSVWRLRETYKPEAKV